MLGLQLALTGVLALGVAAVASFFGEAGAVVAVMMCGLPLAAFQTPGKVVLSRALRFRVLTGVEAVGVLAYYGWAIAWVVAGAGVWALATAVVFRAVAGTCAMAVVSRGTNLLPSLRGRSAPVAGDLVRPPVPGRQRGGDAARAGPERRRRGVLRIGTLGLWTLAKRMLEMPSSSRSRCTGSRSRTCRSFARRAKTSRP